MSLLAASFLCLAVSDQLVDLKAKYAEISKSLLVVSNAQSQTGFAVMIDKRGYFLAHTSVVQGKAIFGKKASSSLLLLEVVYQDEPTQMSLLRTKEGSDLSELQPVAIASRKQLEKNQVIATLLTGPVLGDYIAGKRTGVMQPTSRYVPLGEIRIESPNARFVGTPVFTLDGKLGGMMSGALTPVTDPNAHAQNPVGPTLTVGYSLAPEILARVTSGFLSTSHRPQHPTIGAYFRNPIDIKGAEIVSVMPNSAAEKGGLQVGDIVTSLEDAPVPDAVRFAGMLFDQQVGNSIKLTVNRGGTMKTLKITVGNYDDSQNGKVGKPPAKGSFSVKSVDVGIVG